MMDWSESSGFSVGWKMPCARRVHREIKKNLTRASRFLQQLLTRRFATLYPNMGFYPLRRLLIDRCAIHNFSPLEDQITACNPKRERQMLFDDDH